jgi:hypothetical protein
MDYLLISNGPKGSFTFPFDTLDQCIAQGELELRAGQNCDVYVLHSSLDFEQVTVTPSEVIQSLEATAVTQAEQEAAPAQLQDAQADQTDTPAS